MIRRLALVAVVGGFASVLAVVVSNRRSVAQPVASPQPAPPFSHYVAGVGRLEASTGNIVVGTPVAGLLAELYVAAGDRVAAGDPLFRVDDRDLVAQLAVAAARVDEAEAALAGPRHRLSFNEGVARDNPAAVSTQTLIGLRDEVAVAQAALAAAKAEAARLRVEVERHTVRAPVAGRVLQLMARVGEYVREGAVGEPPLILGDVETLVVRVEVDENDAWRVRPGAAAVATVRGHPETRIPLRFERTEAIMRPKTSLTGLGTERTDVRVLQVLYRFDRAALPVYVGQLVDVFIEAPATTGGARQGSG